MRHFIWLFGGCSNYFIDFKTLFSHFTSEIGVPLRIGGILELISVKWKSWYSCMKPAIDNQFDRQKKCPLNRSPSLSMKLLQLWLRIGEIILDLGRPDIITAVLIKGKPEESASRESSVTMETEAGVMCLTSHTSLRKGPLAEACRQPPGSWKRQGNRVCPQNLRSSRPCLAPWH